MIIQDILRDLKNKFPNLPNPNKPWKKHKIKLFNFVDILHLYESIYTFNDPNRKQVFKNRNINLKIYNKIN